MKNNHLFIITIIFFLTWTVNSTTSSVPLEETLSDVNVVEYFELKIAKLEPLNDFLGEAKRAVNMLDQLDPAYNHFCIVGEPKGDFSEWAWYTFRPLKIETENYRMYYNRIPKAKGTYKKNTFLSHTVSAVTLTRRRKDAKTAVEKRNMIQTFLKPKYNQDFHMVILKEGTAEVFFSGETPFYKTTEKNYLYLIWLVPPPPINISLNTGTEQSQDS